MSKRRKNQLSVKKKMPVVSVPEIVPSFVEAEKLFYLNEKAKNRSKRTIDWHRENLHSFKKALKEQEIELEIEKINPRIIKNNLVLYALDKWNNKPQTVNMRLRTHQFFRFLVSEGYLQDNPVDKIERLSTEKVLIVSLSKDQVRLLLAAPDRNTFTGVRDYTIMNLLLDTGLRVSEISSITLGNLNFKDNYIQVLGKGAKERTVPFQGALKKLSKNTFITGATWIMIMYL